MIKMGLLSRVKNGRLNIIIAALLQWFAMLLNVLITYSLVSWIKNLITINTIFDLKYFIIIIFSLFLKSIATFTSSKILSKLSGEVKKEIRVDIYENYFHLD